MDVISSNELTDDDVRDHLDLLREEVVALEGENRAYASIIEDLEDNIETLKVKRENLMMSLRRKRDDLSYFIAAMNL